MIEKRLLPPDRARKIAGSFAAIEHWFLREGSWAELSHHELILYLFLVLVGDRHGFSYCSNDRICSLTSLPTDEYILAPPDAAKIILSLVSRQMIKIPSPERP